MLVLYRIFVSLLAGVVMLLFHLAAVTVGCMVYAYLFPGIIAMKRGYARTDRVFIACALTGWTVIGWAAALVFALTLPELPDERRMAANH